MTGEILTFNLREFVDHLRVERLLKTKRGLYCFAINVVTLDIFRLFHVLHA